jgi:hypothetical protein
VSRGGLTGSVAGGYGCARDRIRTICR